MPRKPSDKNNQRSVGKPPWFSLADLIVPPFVACPKCGRQQFGIESIGGVTCSRRCKACFARDSVNLPAVSKRVVYLDQFFISNLAKTLNPRSPRHAKTKEQPFWTTAFEQLERALGAQAIVCPASRFQWNESRLGAHAADDFRVSNHLSWGVEFLNKTEIQQHQLRHAALKWFGLADSRPWDPFRGEKDYWNNWMNIVIEYDPDYWEAIEPQHELKAKREREHAAVLQMIKDWHAKPLTFADERRIHAQEYGAFYVREFGTQWQQHCALFADTPELLGDYVFRFRSHLKFASVLHAARQAGLDGPTAYTRSTEFFASDAFARIPYVDIWASMHACLADELGRGRKKAPSPGFTTDVTMLATLAPYCDAMFVDKECARFARELQRHGALVQTLRIFSLDNKEEFLKYLQELEHALSPEHQSALVTAYGDDWWRSYSTMYSRRDE